jgi:hypothetical protein
LAGQSHRRIAAVVLDSDMTTRFGAVRLLAFELLLPPTRFSTRFVSASELIAFGIFISNHLGGSPFGSRGCRDERRWAIADPLQPLRLQPSPTSIQPPPMLSIAYGFVALSARSRYSSAFFRNSSAFDAMAESPITPVNG